MSRLTGWAGPGVVGLAVTLLVAATGAGIVQARQEASATSRDELCAAYVELATALQLPPRSAITAQIRRGAARVGELAQRFPVQQQLEAEPANNAAERLRSVLAGPAPLAYDVTSASRPVAVACGLDWRAKIRSDVPLPILTPGQVPVVDPPAA